MGLSPRFGSHVGLGKPVADEVEQFVEALTLGFVRRDVCNAGGLAGTGKGSRIRAGRVLAGEETRR